MNISFFNVDVIVTCIYNCTVHGLKENVSIVSLFFISRYDGIYKVKKYWPQKGKSGFIVWRYLLAR